MKRQYINLVVVASVGKVLNDIIKNNTTTTTLPSKVLVMTGSFVLGMMLSNAVEKYTNAKLDELAIWWNETVKYKI